MVKTKAWREIAHAGYDKGHEAQLFFPHEPWWGGLTPIFQAIKVVTPSRSRFTPVPLSEGRGLLWH